MARDETLKRTALHEVHVEAGARLVEFAGWEMPVQYEGVIEEHRAVRNTAGVFDVSHMGEIAVSGEEAEAALQSLTPNDVARLRPGRAHYSALLTEEGTYIDDLLLYRMTRNDFLLVVNASNLTADFAWVRDRIGDRVTVEDHTDRYALIAVQGPEAPAIVEELAEVDLGEVKYYGFTHGRIAGAGAMISRTGYTGEDGFELYLAPGDAPSVWGRLLESGAGHGLRPAGLGARDTLRLEAGMALYGHEIDRDTNPWEAGLGWTVKLDSGDFVGRDALVRARAEGPERELVGFEVTGRGIARQGFVVLVDGEPAGEVTSGTWSPTFEKALGMAYVPVAAAESGRELAVEIRGRAVPARIVDLPFYRRER